MGLDVRVLSADDLNRLYAEVEAAYSGAYENPAVFAQLEQALTAIEMELARRKIAVTA